MRLENLKQKIDTLAKDLHVFKTDRDRFTKKLKDEHDLNVEDIPARLDEIDRQSQKIGESIIKLERKTKKMLEDVEDALL